MKELCIIIPCYNESESIIDLLNELHKYYPLATLLVVDDCSKDNSRELVREYSQNNQKVHLIALPINLGIGGAMQTGFKFAFRNGFQYGVKVDGDGQHPADQIKKLLTPLINNQADFVIGTRFLEKKGFQSTFLRRIGIYFFKFLNLLLTGQIITDNTSGFRAYNQKALKFASQHYPNFDYPEPEEVVLMIKNKFVLKEIQVEMKARTGGKSSINLKKSFYYMCKVTFASIIASIRPLER